MKELPSVSCMCLTYGRPHLLEEAIQCFLDQDYKGQKELIVFNDLPQQEFLYTHPQVKIINLKERYKTIGEKRNACVDFCTGDLLFVWDDDDLYLPWRITLSVRMIGKNEYFKSSKAWFINNGVISGPTKNLFHSASCFTKSLFFRAGKYDEINSGQDLTMEKKFVDLQSRPITSLSNRDLYYIYRWQGTDSYHLSAFGMDKMDTKRMRTIRFRITMRSFVQTILIYINRRLSVKGTPYPAFHVRDVDENHFDPTDFSNSIGG